MEFKAASTMTPEQATGSLTGWDRIAIKKATGTDFKDLDALTTAQATVWCVENRDREDKLPWSASNDWSLDELNGFFLEPENSDPLDSPKKSDKTS